MPPAIEASHEPLAHSIQQISSLTSLSTRTVERAIRAGAIPSRKFGRRRIVLRSDLLRVLRGEKGGAR